MFLSSLLLTVVVFFPFSHAIYCWRSQQRGYPAKLPTVWTLLIISLGCSLTYLPVCWSGGVITIRLIFPPFGNTRFINGNVIFHQESHGIWMFPILWLLVAFMFNAKILQDILMLYNEAIFILLFLLCLLTEILLTKKLYLIYYLVIRCQGMYKKDWINVYFHLCTSY